MLGIGWTEMLVIGVVALIVIGPKDLPVVMGRVGKVIGQIQRMGREFQREINKSTGLDEVRSLRNTIANPLKQTADEIRKEFNSIGKDGQQSPTGVLKPTDPKVESVAEAIKEQAGMTPAKSSTELASDYGFKPQAAKPVAGTKTTPPTFSDTATAKAAAKPAAKKAAARSASAGKTRAAGTSKAEAPSSAAAAPKPAELKASPAKPRAAKAETAKPKTAKARPASATKAAPAGAAADKPAAKPRAARKKPAETAGKN